MKVRLLLLALMMPATAQAVIISFGDFANGDGLALNGSATVGVNNGVDPNSVLRLTPALNDQAGSAFSAQTINAAGFSTFFRFRITNSGGLVQPPDVFGGPDQPGADGIVFVVQSVSSSAGTGGGGIGYRGVDNSIGVEFDTWRNGADFDPSSNHLGIDSNGSLTSLTTVDVTTQFNDGNLWYAWVDYDGTTLEARVNQTGVRPVAPTLSQALDLVSILGQTDAYVGFTSGTGGGFGDHDVLSWTYRDEFNPVPEPQAVGLLLLGAIGVTAGARRRSG